MDQVAAACGIIPVPTRKPNFMSAPNPPGSIGNIGRQGPYRALAAALVLFLAAACSTTGPDATGWTKAPAVSTAETAFARGDYAAAAAAWQAEALQATPERAAALQVSAANAWLLAGDTDGAERALSGVAKDQLTPADQSRLNLVLADLALRAGHPDEAAVLLRRAALDLPDSSSRRYDALQAQTRQLLASPSSSALAQAARLSNTMAVYDPIAAIEMMRVLENVTSGELTVRAANPLAELQFAGWLDLALVVRRNLVIPDRVGEDVAAWKLRHPSHLLTESEALDTWLGYRQLFGGPRSIAVLLPDATGLKAAGNAIRDGLLSAYLTQPDGGQLSFIPVAEDLQSVSAAYFSALDAGADHIVGPLRKEAVEALVNLPGLMTPVLALNDLPAGFVPPAGLDGQLNSMSLSQEAEAGAIATEVAASDFCRAIVIAPESPWGERMAATFQSGFLQDERQVIAATRYLDTENDHSAVLERLLLIDESKARARSLENVLRMPLEFEPTRRDDVDVIFMAANPIQARQLRPQLRFFDAGDIPVYATGRIYSGQPDPGRNQDLDDIRFPTTPWELAHATKDDIPELASLRNGSLGALFALGQDAWNILRWLDLMRKDPDFAFPGQSGTYRMTAGGNLERAPAWGEFRLGLAVPLTTGARQTAAGDCGPAPTSPAGEEELLTGQR